MWKKFLAEYNGITVMPDLLWSDNESLQLYTDSAGGSGRGFGIYFQGKWAYGLWPDSWMGTYLIKNISFLELFPVVTAVSLWGKYFMNKKVLFHIDNMSVVHILNKKTSKDPNIMCLVRRLVLSTLQFNIIIRGQHISGYNNVIADSISRCQWRKFREMAPEADREPTILPPWVWEI